MKTSIISNGAMTRKKTEEIIVFICLVVAGISPAETNYTSTEVSSLSPDTNYETSTALSSNTVTSSLPGLESSSTNQSFTTSPNREVPITNSNNSSPEKVEVIKKSVPYAILVGVGMLFLLFIVNLISVIQRRKDHHVIQSYLLSLHTLLPFLRNYAEIAIDEEDPNRKKSSQGKVFGNHIEEYDEIEIVARRSKTNEAKDTKRVSEAEHSKKVEEEKKEEEEKKNRSNVYSLQKEIFSSDL